MCKLDKAEVVRYNITNPTQSARVNYFRPKIAYLTRKQAFNIISNRVNITRCVNVLIKPLTQAQQVFRAFYTVFSE